jgi:transketolase C-terminal domain/subunit
MAFRLFKKKKPENEAVIDLTKIKEIQDRTGLSEAATNTAVAVGQDTSDVGFLGTLANAASVSGSQPNQLSHIALSEQNPEKFARLSRRLDHLLDRLELIERKIERIEHRVDLRY